MFIYRYGRGEHAQSTGRRGAMSETKPKTMEERVEQLENKVWQLKFSQIILAATCIMYFVSRLFA